MRLVFLPLIYFYIFKIKLRAFLQLKLQILIGNRMGVIRIFDAQSNLKKPTTALHISCENEKVSSSVNWLTYHPTKQHIVLGGSEEGSLTVWDLRNLNYPANYFTAHNLGIAELAFHRSQPSKALSASYSGELWLWDQNNGLSSFEKESNDIDPWLKRATNKFNVTSLIEGLKRPINSFDVNDSKVICGCDNEAIYLIKNIF